MNNLSLYKAAVGFLLTSMIFSTNSVYSQILPVNQGSLISGPEVVCAEQKGSYKFKHDVKDCKCDNIEWSVTNGVFDEPFNNVYPFNTKVKIKWSSGFSFGELSMIATNCYTEKNSVGDPIYESDYNRSETYTVHILDANMMNLSVSGQSLLSCNTSIISLHLNSLNSHINPHNLQGIQWNVPSQWTIEPNQQVGNQFYGATFPNIKINTNGLMTGQNTVTVTYGSPSGCPSNSFSRSVTFNIEDCKPVITYSNHPNFHKSHSAESTHFNFSEHTSMASGHNYTFVSGGRINLNPNFEIQANEETTFDAFIEDCSCNSPWHNPNQKGEVSVIFVGNFSSKLGLPNTTTILEDKGTYSNSFNELDDEARVAFFPNPSNGNILIEAYKLNGFQILRVIDFEGRSVKEVFHNFDENKKVKLDLTTLPKGMYFLKIISFKGEIVYYSKLILQ